MNLAVFTWVVDSAILLIILLYLVVAFFRQYSLLIPVMVDIGILLGYSFLIN